MIDDHSYPLRELPVHWISQGRHLIYVLLYSFGVGGLWGLIFFIYFLTFLCLRYYLILQHVLQFVGSIRNNISLNHYLGTLFLFVSWSYASAWHHYLLTFKSIFYFLVNLIFNFSLKIWMVQSY